MLQYMENSQDFETPKLRLFYINQWLKGKIERQPHTLNSALTLLQQQIKSYTTHKDTQNTQAEALNLLKKNLQPGIIILLVDFAENFTMRHQDEISAAHFQRDSSSAVTIYTCVAYYKTQTLDQDNPLVTTFAIMSDTTKHTSLEVQV